MSAVSFFADSLRDLSALFDKSLDELTLDQLHFRPENKGNHIAFTIWHCTRYEDNMVSLLQQRDSVWTAEQWHTKLALPERSTGSGMTEDEAAAIRLPVADFKEYKALVRKNTDQYLSTLSDSDLEKTVNLGRFGERPVIKVVGNILLTHGYAHTGEIAEIRCLMPK